MTTDQGDIEFGEVQAAQCERRLRPDRNRQFCTVACGLPSEDELPIFVDLDALGDMEAHALSDTRVELGGVVLGGQYEDDQGRPFVVIADTLRARHYESTPGSFKFTHETWAEFTRQRGDLPPDLQMVGWYHTHPHLGVFLSDMDNFICEHFFNGPGDVALVIDPCQGKRGFFQWTGEVPNRTKRCGGFYIFASRHREWELTCFAAYLEGRIMGANDPRAGVNPFPGTPYPVPPAPYADPRGAWFGLAVLGMLFIQFLLLALLGWKTLVPEPKPMADATPPLERPVSAAEGKAAGAADRLSREAEIQLRLLDRIVDQLGQGTPQGLVRLLEQLQQENETRKADARVYRALEAKVKADNEALSRVLAAAEEDKSELGRQVARLQDTVREKERAADEYRRKIASLTEPAPSGVPPEPTSEPRNWTGQSKILALAGIGILVAGAVGWVVLAARRRQREPRTEEEA